MVWDGSDIRLVTEWGDVESLVERPRQQVFHLLALPVGNWRDEAQGEVRYIRRDLVSRGVPALSPQEAMEA
jgi:hypothetical protein